MANPVMVTDLVARWRPLSTVETTVAESLLADAWAIMLAQVSGIEARLAVVAPATTPALSPDLVIAVETAMVLRVLRNPDGKRQESIDDYAWTRDNAVSAGLLYLSDEELAMLGAAGASSDAFSIRPYGAPDAGVSGQWTTASTWVPFA